MGGRAADAGAPGAGLCNRCAFQALVPTRRSVFSRCLLAERDARFVKYPAVPVVACTGFAARGSDASEHGVPDG